ncbi:MAG: SpoIIE family protein phosphatase [Brevinematia bacterium]
MTVSKNIAVVAPDIRHPYTYKMWVNLLKFSENYNFNLYFFVGNQLNDIDIEKRGWNFIYDLITPEKFDGLIVFAGSLFHYVGVEEAVNYYKKLKKIPIVNISLDIGNFPVVLTDNKSGIKEVIKHFVSVHNRKKILFITGPKQHPEAIDRFEAYKEGLKENGLEFNPEFVLEGDFHPEKALNSIKKFITKKIDFDAIVASNDLSALTVMDFLQKNGYRVPEDFIIAGYDDSYEAQFSIPSLSSVHQPLEKMVKKALEMLSMLLENKKFERSFTFNTYFVPRESCGCISEQTSYFVFKQMFKGGAYLSSIEFYNSECEQIINLIHKAMKGLGFKDDVELERIVSLIEDIFFLIDGFSSSRIKGFIKTLSEFLIKASYNEVELKFLHKLFGELRHLIISRVIMNEELLGNLDRIFKEVNDVIFAYTINYFKKSELENKNFSEKLDYLIQKILSSHNNTELKDSFKGLLPELNDGLFIFNLFENLDEEKKQDISISRVVSIIKDSEGVDFEEKDALFDSVKLFPDFLETKNHKNFLVLPLVVRNSKFGFLVIEIKNIDPLFYLSLRQQLSISISNNLLLYEVIRKNFSYQKELEMARKVQLQLLPSSVPNQKISFFYQPIANVGGDFFYFIDNPEKKEITFFIFDVAGHGMAAAIITSMIKSFILQYKRENLSDPAQFLSYLNNSLAEEEFDQYVTAFLSTFNFETLEFTYCSAAHPMPFVINNSKVTQIENKNVRSLALGIYCGNENICYYNNYTIRIEPDTRIIFYTDGLLDWIHNNNYDKSNEEMNKEREKFFKFLLSTKKMAPKLFIKELENKINSDVKREKSRHQDDICVVCFDV